MENNIEESFKNLFDIDENPKSIEELMEGIENPTTNKPSNNLEEMFKELQETRDNNPEHVAESVDWDGKPLTEKQIEAKKLEIETLQKFLTKNLRNPAAHDLVMNREKAETTINYLLFTKQLLVKFYEKMK